jgi:hypothetical protein
MYGELDYAAAYVHLFTVLCCVSTYISTQHNMQNEWTYAAV